MVVQLALGQHARLRRGRRRRLLEGRKLEPLRLARGGFIECRQFEFFW
jgi:hypothetical protein